MAFQWIQVNSDRLEYHRTDEQKTCVGEVLKRPNASYEAIAFRKGQRSNRLLLHRGGSASQAMDAVVEYFRAPSQRLNNL